MTLNLYAMKKVFLYLIAALVCMTGCNDENSADEGNESVAMTGITVDTPSLTLLTNSKRQIIATPVPPNATDVLFEWSSDDPDAVMVSQDGTVFVKRFKTGITTVTVKCGSIEETVQVTVQEVPLEGITLNVNVDDTIKIPIVNATRQINAKPKPLNATEVEFVFRSEDESVVIVDQTGKITARSDGKTNIIISSGSIIIPIAVSVGLEDIIVNPAAIEMFFSDVQQIQAIAVPQTDFDIPYIWESDNTSIATVSSTGEVRAGEEEGTVNITVSFGSITKTVAVTVKDRTQPFKGPHILSATAPLELPACDFDTGGEGFAFHDDNGHDGDSYRQDNGDNNSQGVDTEGNGGNIGWPNADEWLLYTLQVQDAGTYAVDVSASPNGASAQFSLYMDNVLFATGTAQNRGDYQNFYWVSTDNSSFTIRLSEGKHKFKFLYINGFNLKAFKFTRVGD
jgi:uncharacterized protein YjdB